MAGSEIADEYQALIATAPIRTHSYLRTDDISRRAESSNRAEELLAHRWWENHVELVAPEGAGFPLNWPDVCGLLLGSSDYWMRWDRAPACSGWRTMIRHSLESI